MFSRNPSWRRWSGQRDDIISAVGQAKQELESWFNYSAIEDISIGYKNDAYQSEATLSDFNDLHKSRLGEIHSLSIKVHFDRDLRKQKANELDIEYSRLVKEGKRPEAEALEYPPDPTYDTPVTFEFSKSSWDVLRLSVKGTNEVKVDGLTKKLIETLNQSKSGIRGFKGSEGYFPAFIGLTFGFSFTCGLFLLIQKLSHPHQPDAIPWQPPSITAVLVSAFFFFLWRSMPPLEILDSGDRSKFSRFKNSLYVLFIGVVGSVIASALTLRI